MEFIIDQNRKIPNSKTSNLASEMQVRNFFKIKPSDKYHFFFCSSSDWPDLKSICISNEYWNINTLLVDIKEYDEIELGNFLIKPSIPKIKNQNAYGPSTNESKLSKFLLDFQKEVNIKLNENEIRIKFVIDPEEESDVNELKRIEYSSGFSAWGFFYSGIRKYVLANLDRGVTRLQYPIIIFFNDKSISRKAISIFVKAYKTIFDYWKYYSL